MSNTAKTFFSSPGWETVCKESWLDNFLDKVKQELFWNVLPDLLWSPVIPLSLTQTVPAVKDGCALPGKVRTVCPMRQLQHGTGLEGAQQSPQGRRAPREALGLHHKHSHQERSLHGQHPGWKEPARRATPEGFSEQSHRGVGAGSYRPGAPEGATGSFHFYAKL